MYSKSSYVCFTKFFILNWNFHLISKSESHNYNLIGKIKISNYKMPYGLITLRILIKVYREREREKGGDRETGS